MLVAFLVLILVGLASFTRVETQVAANSQAQAQARQNALMALNIALGELQKYTGPDQRTTARSDMDAALADTTTASGRWLGAYGSGAPADYAMIPSAVSAAVVAASDGRGSQAKLLNWLVSGNERTAFDPATDVGVTGNITTPPTVFQFTPNGVVSGLGATSTALSETITIADKDDAPQPARLLVGPNTVGDSVSDYVAAPLRNILAEAPGLGTTPVPIGRYAWWIGDEGMKARANLAMPDATQAPNAFVSAPRAAVELMDAVNPAGTTTLSASQMLDPTGANAFYAPTSAVLGRVLGSKQFPLLANGSAPASAALRTVARYRYHDLTFDSIGVLSDTYAGGLKKDLSALLADVGPPHVSPHADTDFIFPAETSTGARPQFGLPTWSLLRSHVQTTSSAAGLTPTPPGMVKLPAYAFPIPSSIGIGPVMTYAFIGMSYGVPTDVAPPFDAVGNPIKLAVSPMVVLWNPYNCDLLPAKYEVGFRKNTLGRFELQAKNDGDSGAWAARHRLHIGNLDTFNGINDRYVRFIIDNAQGIPAGQSRVFTLGKNGETYSPADDSNPLVNEYHPGYHVVRDTGVVIGVTKLNLNNAAEEVLMPLATYRVAVKGNSHNATQALITNTFFTAPEANFGGNDPHEVYLGATGSVAPGGYSNLNYPYTATFASRRWYQVVGNLLPPYNGAPYGTIPGYSVNDTGNGLFREENDISVITTPTFRLGFFMGFKEGRDRWLAQSNPRALVAIAGNFIRSPIDSGNWPTSISSIGISEPRAHAGMNLKYPATTPIDAQLFEFRPADQPFLTIGQLQHANVSWLNGTASYAIGNSLLPSGYDALSDQVTNAYSSGTGPANQVTNTYDMSWLLNRSLWDRYFVSTVPHKGTGLPADSELTPIPADLPNPLLQRRTGTLDTDLRDADRAAASLMLAGGFNINSTSEQAWRAVLGGINQLEYDPVSQAPTGKRKVALSRFSRPTSGAPAVIDASSAWLGYRELDELQIARLARNIVAEIRSRGPSISLADFINRRLVDTGVFAQPNDKRLKGTIQAAIDATTSGPEAANSDAHAPFDSATTPLVTNSIANATIITNPSRTGQATGGPASAVRVAPYSSPSAFAPQFLTQGDVLSAIGANLSGRSDTFTIRTYGEVVNPALAATDPGYISGRAWCEAVVQRIPDYVDTLSTPNAHAAPSGTINIHHGRRYKIISFKWIGSNDI